MPRADAGAVGGPLVCTVRVGGVGVLLTVYATTDRAALPEGHREAASPTVDGRGLFVAEHAGELDSGAGESHGRSVVNSGRAAAE